MIAGRPIEQPLFHLLASQPPAVFVVPGSMLFDIDAELFTALERGDAAAVAELRTLAPAPPVIDGQRAADE